MDENGAQECHMDIYAQFDSLKALEIFFQNLTTGFSRLYRVLLAESARFPNWAFLAGMSLCGREKPLVRF